MDINFSDISRLATGLNETQQLCVDGEGKVGVVETSVLEGRTIRVLPEGSHVLSQEEFFDALARCAGQAFADSLRDGLEHHEPLSGREIRQIVDRSKVAIETASHLHQLETGLTARAAHAPQLDSLRDQLDALDANPRFAQFLQKPAVAVAFVKVRTALLADTDARAALAGVTGAQVADPAVRQQLARLVDVEGDLAVALNEFAGELRGELNKAASGDEELYLVLEGLEDQALQAESNAAKLDNLTGTLDILANADDQRNVRDEIAHLLDAAPPLTSEETQAVQDGVARLALAAKPLFTALARLDTGDPSATTPETLHALGAALRQTQTALAEFKSLPGVNAGAVREFEAHLAEIRSRYQACTTDVRERLQIDGALQIVTQLGDACDEAAKWGFGNVARQLRRFVTDMRQFLSDNQENRQAILDGLKPNGTLALHLQSASQYVTTLNSPHTGNGKSSDSAALDVLDLRDVPESVDRVLTRLSAENFGDPVSELDARVLGDVLRGDVDLTSYLELRESGLPTELLRTDLTSTGSVQLRRSSSGALNDVQFWSLRSTRTNSSAPYVVKNIKKTQGVGASFGVASRLSKPSHASQGAKLNFASKKAAHLIGCGTQITSNGIARFRQRFQLVQEVANGATLADIVDGDDKALTITGKDGKTKNVSVKKGLRKLPPAARARVRRELQIQFAKLEWADWLSGQLDRHRNNLMVAIDVQETDDPDHPHISVEVRGIDNDASFPEGRPKLDTFKLNERSRVPGTYTLNNWRDTMTVYEHGFVRSSRPPSFLPASVQKAISDLTVDEFRRQMAGLLSPRALASAVSRFQEMKDRLDHYAQHHRVIDDSPDALKKTDDEVIQEDREMSEQGQIDFDERASLYNREYARSVLGGFFASLFD